jgi:hypothetical protein
MATPYRAAFENFFRTLPISRVNYKALAQYSLVAAQDAKLPDSFAPTLKALDTHIAAFDENLVERLDPTASATEAFRQARLKWLAFVDDTMKDYVTPKLRKAPAYADFKKFSKSKLRNLSQPALLVESKTLLQLYSDHAAELSAPTLVADAQAVYDALAAADTSRDHQGALLDNARVALTGDRAAIADDLFALKNHLHLHFPTNPDKVYSFFDFSKLYR